MRGCVPALGLFVRDSGNNNNCQSGNHQSRQTASQSKHASRCSATLAALHRRAECFPLFFLKSPLLSVRARDGPAVAVAEMLRVGGRPMWCEATVTARTPVGERGPLNMSGAHVATCASLQDERRWLACARAWACAGRRPSFGSLLSFFFSNFLLFSFPPSSAAHTGGRRCCAMACTTSRHSGWCMPHSFATATKGCLLSRRLPPALSGEGARVRTREVKLRGGKFWYAVGLGALSAPVAA